MRKLFQILLCGLLITITLQGCVNDVRASALDNLRQMKAENYFKNQNEIEICHAIEWGDTNKIQKLLNGEININTQGYKDDMTFVMWALLKQNKSSYQYLLENRADPNLKTTNGSIMNFVVIPEDPFWLKLALEHGGDPNTPSGNQSIIFKAIEQHRIENINLLLKTGADINYQNKISKDTPLVMAMNGSRYNIAYMLLEKGANPELKKRDIIFIITKTRPYSDVGDYEQQVEWREKVIKLLEQKGFKFE